MRTKKKKSRRVNNYRHDEKRKNNPPVGIVSMAEKPKKKEKKTYAYDPHLSPQLVWAGKPGLKSIEVEDEAGVKVETVSLHIHERVSTKAIIEAVQREEKQADLFADPQLPLQEAVKFYQHDVDWANRLILGDSLLVANSLIERELMAGKVQMIYVDPPYGIKYSSNFQPRIDRRDVKDGDEYLTREPEQIKAYRDTWTLGIHSYLTYLRDRLRVCRDLLTDSGSIFVQMNDENLHLVRSVMDEVFGQNNFCSFITFEKTSFKTSGLIQKTFDVIIWYAKEIERVKRRQLFFGKTPGDIGAVGYAYIVLPDGRTSRIDAETKVAEGGRVFELTSLISGGTSERGSKLFEFEGKRFDPGTGQHWKTTPEGMVNLAKAGRIRKSGNKIRFVHYLEDYPVSEITNNWSDTRLSSFGDEKVYVVQTATKVVKRCLLLTTDPGDLVFDPTCGSGTTAYVAEKWGRRWITCDTSRVALALARQRLLTATFPMHRIESDNPNDRNPRHGFVYKTVSHVTLKCIAQNTRIDPVAEKYDGQMEKKLKALNEALGKSLKKWEMPFEPEKGWFDEARRLHKEFRELKRQKQAEIDRIIAEDAPQETLYDQPEVARNTVRVSGPFTVEAIPPPVYDIESPIEGVTDTETGTSDSHIATLIDLLRKDGVTFPGNKKLNFTSLTPRTGGVLHAEGETGEGKSSKRYAVSFGPLHGPVTLLQVEDGLREAYRGGYDGIIFCGFAFEPEAQAAIEASPSPKLTAHLSHIRPDVILTDDEGGSLLKTTASSQLFAVFGEPDIKLQCDGDEYVVHLQGVDVYDPITGQVNSENADRVAAWFVDTDYDGRTFCIVQAFFPNKSAWDKLERALKGTLDKDRFDMLTGQTSLPFKAGKHKKAAVKVIDQRGNEVMKVVNLGQGENIRARQAFSC